MDSYYWTIDDDLCLIQGTDALNYIVNIFSNIKANPKP